MRSRPAGGSRDEQVVADGVGAVAPGLTACGRSPSRAGNGVNDGVSPAILPPANRDESGSEHAAASPRQHQPVAEPGGRAVQAAGIAAAAAGRAGRSRGRPAGRPRWLRHRQQSGYPRRISPRRRLSRSHGRPRPPEPERTHSPAEIGDQALTQLIEREVVLQDAFAKLEKVRQEEHRQAQGGGLRPVREDCCATG